MAKKITKAAIDNLKVPEKGEVSLWDSELEGFGVRVQAGGRKVYLIRYRAPGDKTQRKMTIARCSDVPPDKAREMARREFAKIAEGQDPVAERKPKAASDKPKLPTVEAMFLGYIASMRDKGRASTDEVERALLKAGNNAADALGRHKQARDVTSSDIIEYVATLFDAGHRGAADKHRSYISSAFTWAIKSTNDYTVKNRQDWGIEHNPASDVARDQEATQARDRNLSILEMRRLWLATDPEQGEFTQTMGTLLRTLMLCGQRVHETLRMEVADLDLKKGLWVMPAMKTKGRKLAHVVPLPKQLVPLLAELAADRGDGYIFRSSPEDGGGMIRYSSVNTAVKRWVSRTKREIFQPRDLRRTWKSRAHDAGVDRHTRDLIQQHAKNDTGSKHYDRADYLPQMVEGMRKWSTWLDASVCHPQLVAVTAAIPRPPMIATAA